MIRLVNAAEAQTGPEATLIVDGELVAGSGVLAPFGVGTDLPILTAGVSMKVFSDTVFGYESVDGYARPDAISISFTANHALNFGDRIVISVPELHCYLSQQRFHFCFETRTFVSVGSALRQPEFRNPQLETWNPEPGTQSPEPKN